MLNLPLTLLRDSCPLACRSSLRQERCQAILTGVVLEVQVSPHPIKTVDGRDKAGGDSADAKKGYSHLPPPPILVW